jgi:hypothetical protein
MRGSIGRWIGRWIIGVSIIHTIFAFAVFGKVIASMVNRGVFNTVGTDPMTAATAWFLLFGVLLFIYGLNVNEIEKSTAKPLPKSIGWSLLALGLIGVILMPASGFWLIFPPSIVVLTQKAKA